MNGVVRCHPLLVKKNDLYDGGRMTPNLHSKSSISPAVAAWKPSQSDASGGGWTRCASSVFMSSLDQQVRSDFQSIVAAFEYFIWLPSFRTGDPGTLLSCANSYSLHANSPDSTRQSIP